MSFSFNEDSNSDDSCEIKYFKSNINNEQLNKSNIVKLSSIIPKTVRKTSFEINDMLNLNKNSFSYDNNTHIGKEVKMNSEDAATEFTSNYYSTNNEVSKTFTRQSTFGISKYSKSTLRKYSNISERIKYSNNFLNKKNFIEKPVILDNENILRQPLIAEERKSNICILKKETEMENKFKRKSEIVLDYINKLKDKDNFAKYKDLKQRERKSKFSIFEERLNSGKKRRNLSKENDKIGSKKVFFLSFMELKHFNIDKYI